MGAASKLLRDPPPCLQRLFGGLHQDFNYQIEQHGGLDGTLAQMPREWLAAREWNEARDTIRTLLDTASASDLKGMLRRSDAAWHFDAKTARHVFEVWAKAMETDL